METTGPAQTVLRFADCLAAGDLEAALGLYEPEAVFQASPEVPAVGGRAAIRDALGPFFALGGKLASTIVKVHEAGDVALVVNRWTLRATQPDGSPLELQGTSADVLTRRDDGSWGILVDDPWGAAV